MQDIGESIVGAYLRHVRKCDLVLYNEHTGANQGEIDVIGIRSGKQPEVWLCEVATHIRGLQYGTFAQQNKKISDKVKQAKDFADRIFDAHQHHIELWSPYVPAGQVTAWMEDFAAEQKTKSVDVAFVINDDYTEKVQQLIDLARKNHSTTGEPAFRMLQILTHARGDLTL